MYKIEKSFLLSSTVEIITGNQHISLGVQPKMIASGHKLKRRLVKSDVYPRDKQKFASCEKTSSNMAISTLKEITDSFVLKTHPICNNSTY